MTLRNKRSRPSVTVRRQGFARTAAPEGGARSQKWRWVRGCAFIALCASANPLWAQEALPSGQIVTLHEVLSDEVNGEKWLRFRFLAPQIARMGGSITHIDAEPDFPHLCETVARPYLDEYDLTPDVIAITLMDRPVPFAQADTDATQFIEVFRIDGDACVWEAF